MTKKIREYRAKAAEREERARKTHNLKDREWELVLASAYRMLAEIESEAAGPREQTAA